MLVFRDLIDNFYTGHLIILKAILNQERRSGRKSLIKEVNRELDRAKQRLIRVSVKRKAIGNAYRMAKRVLQKI